MPGTRGYVRSWSLSDDEWADLNGEAVGVLRALR
jgi:hypothetical protein